jgi:peptidoglycan/LPS O-acetylase OafA/YrhL
VLVWKGLTVGDPEKFNWKFMLFLQNFNTYFTDFFWESWSLTIEEWFYILTPLTMLLLHFLLQKSLHPKYIFLSVISIFILFPLFYRISISPENVDPFWFDVKFRKVVLTRLDAIMFGVLFAWLRYYYPETWKKISVPFFIAGIVLLYLFMHLQAQETTGYYSKTIFFTCMGLSAAMLLPFAERTRSFRTRFGKIMTHISLISYSMYLINLCLVADVIRKNFESEVEKYPLLMYLVFWIMVILISTLIYKYFEKPVMDLRDYKVRRSEFSGEVNIKT